MSAGPKPILRALTIAGSDPSGGAGIQRDLQTFHALGVWGLSAVTCVTVQDTSGVRGRHDVPPEVVAAQIDAVLADAGAAAMKTGLLPTPAAVAAVAEALSGVAAPLVVDPVAIASSGDPLADPEVPAAICSFLLPLAAVTTPNAPEASALTGIEVCGAPSQREAARALRDLGPPVAVVTGGHLPGDEVVDVYAGPDGEAEFRNARVPGADPHGTGCLFSAALTAYLALGETPREAAGHASETAMRGVSEALAIGRGRRVAGIAWPAVRRR